jgi:hypothetical protein
VSRILDEDPLPLALLARHCPPSTRTGRHPHPSVLWRWCFQGLKTRDGRRVRLEAVKAGSATVSSVAALRRFWEALAAASGLPGPSRRETEKEAAEVSRGLVAAGLKTDPKGGRK